MKHLSVHHGLLIILSVFFITNAYSQGYKFVPELSSIILPVKGKEMLHQCSRSTPKRVQEFFILTQGQVDTLEFNFKKALAVKSEQGKKIKSLSNFGFQFIGVVIKDKKYIYVNAFLVKTPQDLFTKYKEWKNNPIIVCKGGKSFWGILFDCENEKFSQLEINDNA